MLVLVGIRESLKCRSCTNTTSFRPSSTKLLTSKSGALYVRDLFLCAHAGNIEGLSLAPLHTPPIATDWIDAVEGKPVRRTPVTVWVT